MGSFSCAVKRETPLHPPIFHPPSGNSEPWYFSFCSQSSFRRVKAPSTVQTESLGTSASLTEVHPSKLSLLSLQSLLGTKPTHASALFNNLKCKSNLRLRAALGKYPEGHVFMYRIVSLFNFSLLIKTSHVDASQDHLSSAMDSTLEWRKSKEIQV